MAPKKLENNFLLSTLGKLLVFLVNYAYYATLSYYEKVWGALSTGKYGNILHSVISQQT
jgi:hypothetical protein